MGMLVDVYGHLVAAGQPPTGQEDSHHQKR